MTTAGRWDDLDEILEAGAEALAADYLAATGDESEIAGDVIGRYRLIEPIGRGGMGTVWRAERADGEFDHQVALKLVKRGMDTDEILARFRRERQILARLQHPHIARLLDGGAAPDGRPYFVLEHVAGLPITDYCDARSLSVDARLRLFVTVCRTVQYAHRNLIVHRDLKPGNVLVDETGEVKLLDFGIALVLQDPAIAATVAGARVLTPEYASPEQLRGEEVTTASDVYQLGALLYELLAGRRPGPAAGAGRPEPRPAPARPSTAVRRTQEIHHRDGTHTRIDPAVVGARRATSPEGLRRRLRGDLDSIALAALRLDPDSRPPSADALADDVELHLAHRPIRHGGGRLGYEAGKFMRRHRIAAGTVAGTAALVVGLVTYYTLELRRERDTALREADQARVTADLVERFFESWDPDEADHGQVTSEDVLGEAVRRAERELGDRPQTLAATLSVLGGLHTSLGATATADSLLARALSIQEGAPGPSDPYLAATLGRRARLLQERGDFLAAERSLRRAIDIDRRALGPRHPETLRLQRDLGAALRSQTRLPEAETELRGVLAALGPRPAGARSTLAVETAAELGYVLFLLGRYDEAVGVLRPVLAAQRDRYGTVHAATLYPMRALASALRDRGDLDEAERLYREAMEITRALYGEDHVQTYYSAAVLSLVLQRRGRLEESESWARRSLVLAEGIYGGGHVNTALALSQLGALRLERGDGPGAEALLRRSLDALRTGFPQGHPDEGDALNRLAWLLDQRQAADAGELYRRAMAFERSRPAEGPFFVTDGYHYLAATALRRGDLPEAEGLYRRSLGMYRRQLPDGHAYRAEAATGLGATLLAGGRPDDGARYLSEGLAQWNRARPAEPERAAEARALLARARSRGRRSPARRVGARRRHPRASLRHSLPRLLLPILLLGLAACVKTPRAPSASPWALPVLESQTIATTERLISVHAVDPRTAWVAGTGGTWGRTLDAGATWESGVVPGADSLQFRDVHAVDGRTAWLLSIGNGDQSRIYRTDDGGASWALQWTNPDSSAFYDCFAFWDEARGFAFSDAVDGVFPLIATTDGRTWERVADPPPGREGEGSFAASGTCVATRGDSLAWFGTGAGPSARVFRTADRGRTWTFAETPIADGTATTGIASVAFMDDLRGAAFGGDVAAPATPTASVAVTTDGGRTWELAGRPERPGAVYGGAFVQGAPTPTMIAVGPAGLAWSADFGTTWTTADTTDHWGVAFAGDGTGWAVGPAGRITRIRFGER